MTTAYTSLLGLALPVTGELSGTWGDTVNTAITSLLDTAVAGTTSITTDADITLTTTTGASNQARQAIILWNPASGTTTRNITAPAQSKIYTVINASGGTQSIVIRGAGPTTGVTIVKGESAVVAWNGSDFIKVSNTGGSASFTNVTVSGTTTLSGLTASTALALDASKNVVSVANTGTGNNVLSASPTLTGTVAAASLSLSSLTATRVPFAGVAGLLSDSANMTFNGTRLTVADLADSGLTSGRVTYASTGGALVDSANLTFDGTNLGIGTTSPGASLDVAANSTTDGGKLRLSNLNTNITTGGTSGEIEFYNADATVGAGISGFIKNLATDAGRNYSLTFGTGDSATIAERMRIDSIGNVGIGTNAPLFAVGSGLEIERAGAATLRLQNTGTGPSVFEVRADVNTAQLDVRSNLPLVFATNSTERMRLDSAGNLGIGTSSPSASLQIQRSTPSFWMAETTSGTLQRVEMSVSSAGVFNQNLNWNSGNTNRAFTWSQGGTENVRIDSGGNFLVGTNTVTYSAAGRGVIEVNGGSTAIYALKVNGSGAGYIYHSGSDMSVWNVSNNAILFGTNNTERMRLDSSGNLGLGVTPSAWSGGYKAIDVQFGAIANTNAGSVDVAVTQNAFFNGTNWITKYSGQSKRQVLSDAGFVWHLGASQTAGNAISFTQAMTLTAGGSLGVGTTSPVINSSGNTIHLNTTTAGHWSLFHATTAESGAGGGDGSIYGQIGLDAYTFNYESGNLIFGTSGTERARITSGGQLLVGTTTTGLNTVVSSGGFQTQGTSQFNIYSTNSSTQFEWVLRSGTEMQFFVSSASVVARLTASGVWTDASDARYKENIRPIPYGLAEVMQLQPRTYNVIGSARQEIGFVAQEVEPLLPELVESTKNSVTGEDRMTLSYGQLSAVLVKAIQELKAEFDAYKASHP